MKKCLLYMGLVVALVFAISSSAYAESRPHTDAMQEKSVSNFAISHFQMQEIRVEGRDGGMCTRALTKLSEANPVADQVDQREPEADAENLANSEKVLVVLTIIGATLLLVLFLFRKR